MSDLINHIKGYSASVKTWNKATFNDSIYAFPKKGFAPYNQVQKLRLGQDITPLKTVKQMEKPEEPIKIVKPKPEAKKEEAKKDKPEAKKSKKKSKPKTEVAKEKAEKKEKAVKQAIQAIIKEEAPAVNAEEEIPHLVIKEVDDLDDLEKTVARMEALEKMAETSGYIKTEDGKKIHDEFLDLQKKLKKYEDHHTYESLKKKNADLARRVNGRVSSNTIQGVWANRIHDEQVKAKEEAVPEAYRNSLKSYNDAEYWKKTSAKEKKEYLASVYGMKASDQEYITRHMHGHLDKAYKAYKNKMAKAQTTLKEEVKEEIPVVAKVKGRSDMTGAEMAQYDIAKQRKDRPALKKFHEAFPGLVEIKQKKK